MKKLEIVIAAEKLETLKDLLTDMGAKGMMVTNIIGFGNQGGYTQIYRDKQYRVKYRPKVKVEVVVRDNVYEAMLDKIYEKISTGNIGDGKVFVYDVIDALRVRDGQRGCDAV